MNEEQQQIDEAMSRARSALTGVSRIGLAGMALRGISRSVFRMPRIGRRKVVVLGIGLLIAALSIVTCSAGVNPGTLTAEYGEPIPATIEAAQRFAQRTARAVQSASTSRRFRITIPEAEATSALSLGLMIPELMQALDSLPPPALQQARSIEDLRETLRRREEAARASRTFQEKVAAPCSILDSAPETCRFASPARERSSWPAMCRRGASSSRRSSSSRRVPAVAPWSSTSSKGGWDACRHPRGPSISWGASPHPSFCRGGTMPRSRTSPSRQGGSRLKPG